MFTPKLVLRTAMAAAILSVINIYNNLFFTLGHNFEYGTLKAALNIVNLGIYIDPTATGSNGINYVNGFFYILLLLASLLYLRSAGREQRLFRTLISIVLLSNTLSLIETISFHVWFRLATASLSIVSTIAFASKFIALIYFCYRLLRYFYDTREADAEVHEHDGTALVFSIPANRWQRFTHALLDSTIAFFLLSPFLQIMGYYITQRPIDMSDGVHNITDVFLLAFVGFRVIYAFIFETLFSATPAKMMTETRVTNADGERPGFGLVIARTICRLIPLESLSFLGSNGWHDRLSRTTVICEKPTSKYGASYYWLLPASILLITGYFAISAGLVQHNAVSALNADDQYFKDQMLDKIANPAPNYFFVLQKINDNNDSQVGRFLKVEVVKPDSITFMVIKAYGTFFDAPGQLAAEYAYKLGRDTLKRITFSKRQLREALLEKGASYLSQNTTVKGLPVNVTLYAIKDIGAYFQTNLQPGTSSGYGDNYLNVSVDNTGWTADLVSIDVVQGNATINTKLPLALRPSTRHVSADIEGKVDGNAVDFKLNLTVRDTTGRIQVYQLSGNTRKDGYRTIRRIK